MNVLKQENKLIFNKQRMEVVKVSNLKSYKCEKVISKKLREAGIKDIEVDFENGIVLFEGDREGAVKALAKSGHPEEGKEPPGNWFYKTKAHLYCLVKK
jgi:copper chaperone CopZ